MNDSSQNVIIPYVENDIPPLPKNAKEALPRYVCSRRTYDASTDNKASQ